jgi:hypothetical protein
MTTTNVGPVLTADSLTPEQREVWDERFAICTLDGGLSESEAQVIAWAQIDREFGAMPNSSASPAQELHHAN